MIKTPVYLFDRDVGATDVSPDSKMASLILSLIAGICFFALFLLGYTISISPASY